LHVSPEPQAAQATPPMPQSDADCDDGATQVLPLQHPVGHEVRADGTIALEGGEQRLEARRIEPISPPADPFTYR